MQQTPGRAARLCSGLLLGAALGLLAPAAPARANGGPPVLAGDTHGALVPRQETRVRIDAEALTFDLTGAAPGAARVQAVYRMTNPAPAAADTEVAFVFVDRGGPEAPAPAITVDGQAVEHRRLTDDQILRPAVQDWLAAHPAVAAEARRLAAGWAGYSPELERELAAAGVTDRGAPWLVVEFLRNPTRATVAGAARLLRPGLVQTLTRGWTTWDDAPPAWRPLTGPDLGQGLFPGHAGLTWLVFTVPFPPGTSRTVSVGYTQTAAVERRGFVNPVYHYEYLLSPARSWAGFGPLHIRLRAPAGTHVSASLPMQRASSDYVASLPGLPPGEFHFAVMSGQGVLLGLLREDHYWYAVLAAATALAVALGWRLGRCWGRAPYPQRLLLALAAAAAVALAVAGGLWGLAALLKPLTHALFKGWAFLSWIALGLIATAAGVTASGAAAWRSARTPPPQSPGQR